MSIDVYDYKHDGGGAEQTMEIERLGWNGRFYRFEVRTTDATDYERLMSLGIVGSYLGNPTFKRRAGREDGAEVSDATGS